MSGTVEIPPRSGTAFELKEGQLLTVIDPQGCQVADLLAYSAADVREVIFEGDRLVYGLHVEALGGMRLLAFDYDRGVRTIAAVGERVGVTWRPDDLMIFPATTNDEGARNP